jgi:hypothetical protein
VTTFGPAYEAAVDRDRLKRQMDIIRDVMLSANECGETWLTLKEIEALTHYGQASISAQLRHCKKPQFGGYILEKRRRGNVKSGLWEYRLSKPEVVLERTSLF